MFKWIYLLLLVSSVAFVLWKGRFEERLVVGALTIGSILTVIIYDAAIGWLDPGIALITNEIAVTCVILFVAYRSIEFWPLAVAAFQMIALLTPVASIMGENLASYALGVMQGLWAYLQLIILVIVTVMQTKKRLATSMK